MTTNRPDRRPQAGFSLVEIVVALGLISLMAALGSKMITNSMRGQTSVSNRIDLDAVKTVLLQNLSCEQTLGPAAGSGSCPASVTLKDKNGKNLLDASRKLGEWTITTSCSNTPGSGGFTFSASKAGNDPLTGKPWANVGSARDLFSGVKLCNQFLGGGCPATHSIAIGGKTSGRCCRNWLQQDIQHQIIKFCNPGEIMLTSAYACHQPPRTNINISPPANYSYASGAGNVVDTSTSPARMGFTAACYGNNSVPWFKVAVVHWGTCCIE